MSAGVRLALLCGVALAVGCSRQFEDKWSRSRPPAFKTNGRITWNGEPAAGALVTLHARDLNLAASGKSDSQGTFVLTTWRLGDGAVAGDHKVAVRTIVVAGFDGGGNPIEVNVMPPQFGNPDTSGIVATVSENAENSLAIEVVGPRIDAPKSTNALPSGKP